MHISVIFQMLSGIALFIFAMSLIEDSLKKMAGRQFKKFLQDSINTKFKAIGAGTIVTAVLQSSSVVLLMVLSFVGAGMITMRNAFAVTLGANLGTTLDSWIIASIGFKMDMSLIAYPFIILAVVFRLLYKRNSFIEQLSNFMIGFSLLFIGLEWMKAGAGDLVEHLDLSSYSHRSPYWFIPFGFVLTVLIQSSSVTMAITLTALHLNFITFDHAIGIVTGSELGTSIKIIFGAIGGINDKKRVALGNFIYNVTLTVFAMVFLVPIIELLKNFIGNRDSLIGLVTFQTGINLFTILLFYPFMGRFGKFLESRFDRSEENKITKFLHLSTRPFADNALQNVELELSEMLQRAIELNKSIVGVDQLTVNEEDSWFTKLKQKGYTLNRNEDSYTRLKMLNGEILEFLLELRKEELKPEELEKIGFLLGVSRTIIHAVKKVKDIEHNLVELENSSNDFLFSTLNKMRISESDFYIQFKSLISTEDRSLQIQKIEELMNENELSYASAVNETLSALEKEVISELDSSTLLNVYRAFHSSHISLFEVLKSIFIKQVN